MSAKAGKRPLRSLTAHEKLDAIRRVHDGESKASVARDIGVPESTLRGWCKNEDKISYLSRQSSPDTDESLEHSAQIKRAKLDESIMQPFNLSLKSSGGTYSPNSDTLYGEAYPKNEADAAKTPLILNTKTETPKSVNHMTERERNRAELARLSVELGLNRPEMFLPSVNNPSSNLADLSANIGLLAQWNNLLMQQQQKGQQTGKGKVTAPADTSTNMVSSTAGLLTTVDQEKHKQILLPKEKQSVHESVWYWLKTQQSMLNLNQAAPNIPNGNGIGTSTSATTPSTTPVTSMANSSIPLNGLNGDQSSWFWKWYKQFAYGQQQQHHMHFPPPDKPILYQQLTKDTPPKDITSSDQQNAENLSVSDEKEKTANKTINNNINNNKARSVLDNLLFNNNNNVAVNSLRRDGKEDEESLSQSEALEHGEKFLKWLEACSDPSVTAMQIMQFRTLLNNVRTGADRKNGDIQNKTKVKRK